MKHRVVIKYFSGTSTSDMKHYMKPTLEKAAPQQIDLPIETNDLRDTKPETVAYSIIDIARLIETESDAHMVLSNLVTRGDEEKMKEAVKGVNMRLKKLCNQNGWRLIGHKNIDSKDLNNSKLHLNEAGNKICNNLANGLGFD